MKKYIFLFFITVAALDFAAGQDVDTYESIYNATATNSGQLALLRQMAEHKVADAADFYGRALKKLVPQYKNIKIDNEKDAANEQAQLLAMLLGAEHYAPAAADLWQVADRFDSASTKAEALIALGSIPATAYLPQIISLLNRTNNSPAKNRVFGERVAHGAIVSLGKFQDRSAYIPVYYASIGWYSRDIREEAAKTLLLIDKDPVPYMVEIIKSAGHKIPIKLLALQSIEASDIDNADKVKVAVAALNEGLRINTRDEILRINLAEMRKLAIQMINKYKTDDESIYPLLERSYTIGTDLQEKLYAISALASQGSEESAKRLSKFLMDLNSRSMSDKITQQDEQLVRAVIPAIAQTGRASGKAALYAVSSSKWTPQVIKLANEAIDHLE